MNEYEANQSPLDEGGGMIHRNWGWFLALGIVLVVLGIIAIGTSVLATFVSVAIFGWLLMIGGVITAIQSFSMRLRHGMLLNLLSGIVYFILGLLMVVNPIIGAISLTLIIAWFFIVGGILRIIAAFSHAYTHRGWVLLNGLITLLLGCMILAQWPVTGLWVIGTFVGIEMIFFGWSFIMLGMVARHHPPALPA